MVVISLEIHSVDCYIAKDFKEDMERGYKASLKVFDSRRVTGKDFVEGYILLQILMDHMVDPYSMALTHQHLLA